MERLALGLLMAIAVPAATGSWARADVYILQTGGRESGELLDGDESSRDKLVIETAGGGRITLQRKQVVQVLHTRPDVQEYERIRPSFADTLDGQWALAEWCFKHRLPTRRKTHLVRIIELDPKHEQARRALGYSQVDGRWVTQQEIMAERGFYMYKGRYRTSQEIELMENRRKTELAQKAWSQKLHRWRDWLERDKFEEAQRAILTIKDPHAVAALSRYLETDPLPFARILYIEALANLDTPEAVKALAACSLEDPVEEVRLTCLDYLSKNRHPDVVAYFVARLRDKDNHVVNLAALALGRINDPSAVRPLVDALVTLHQERHISGNPEAISSTFGTGPGGSGAPGGGGLSMGGGTRIIRLRVANQRVLDALVALTGRNFNFDQRAWTYWLASQQRPAVLDARRD